jgi:hypothetical protein
MKSTTCLVFVLALMPLTEAIPAGPQPFSLVIQAAQQRVQSGSQAEVKLTLTNNSSSEITIVDSNRWCDYALEVRDSHGQLMPKTNYARQLKCSPGTAGRRMIRVLKPGESLEDDMFVNQFYDLGHPDDYYVQVGREIPKELGQGTVKSNIIAVTVAE